MTTNTLSPQQPAGARIRSTAVTATFITMIALNGLEIILFAIAAALLNARQEQMASPSGDTGATDAGAAVLSGLTLVGGTITVCGILQLILYIVCAVAFLTWISKSFRAMKEARPSLIKTSPGYAAGGFFIPIVNLAHGYNMVKELWQASNPASVESEYFIPVRVPAIINWWWGLFLADGVFGWLMNAQKGQSLDDIKDTMFMGMLDCAISIVAAILAIQVVRAASDRINECLGPPKYSTVSSTPSALFAVQPSPLYANAVPITAIDYTEDQDTIDSSSLTYASDESTTDPGGFDAPPIADVPVDPGAVQDNSYPDPQPDAPVDPVSQPEVTYPDPISGVQIDAFGQPDVTYSAPVSDPPFDPGQAASAPDLPSVS